MGIMYSSSYKIGILGGSFDPPTIAHISLAQACIDRKCVNEVWLVPCGDYRKDKKNLVPASHRLKMVELFV